MSVIAVVGAEAEAEAEAKAAAVDDDVVGEAVEAAVCEPVVSVGGEDVGVNDMACAYIKRYDDDDTTMTTL